MRPRDILALSIFRGRPDGIDAVALRLKKRLDARAVPHGDGYKLKPAAGVILGVVLGLAGWTIFAFVRW